MKLERILIATGMILSVNNVTAATVIGDVENYLSPTYLNQIETWLEQGSITLTNVFTATDSTTNDDFHSAVGVNPTIIIESVHLFDSGQDVLIGGYNPQAWNISNSYNIVSVPNSTALIFNLTSNTLFRENTLSNLLGQYQTWNGSDYGPAFGAPDLWNFNTTIGSQGYSGQYSYVSATEDPYIYGQSPVTGGNGLQYFTINGLEAFTIQPSSVPVPGAVWLFGTGLVGLLSFIRRK